MAKPSYKAVHRERKGSATMTIEAAPPSSFTDKELPSSDSERFPKGSISPEPNAKADAKPVTIPTHPGEYGRPLYTGISKT